MRWQSDLPISRYFSTARNEQLGSGVLPYIFFGLGDRFGIKSWSNDIFLHKLNQFWAFLKYRIFKFKSVPDFFSTNGNFVEKSYEVKSFRIFLRLPGNHSYLLNIHSWKFQQNSETFYFIRFFHKFSTCWKKVRHTFKLKNLLLKKWIEMRLNRKTSNRISMISKIRSKQILFFQFLKDYEVGRNHIKTLENESKCFDNKTKLSIFKKQNDDIG